jgi:hypothetical protein
MTTTPALWRPGITDNATLPLAQDSGTVVASSDGTYFAVWLDHGNFPGAVTHVVGRHFDALGNPLSGDVDLSPTFTGFNVDTGGTQPVNATLLPSGGIAVAFVNEFLGGTDPDVWIVRTTSTLGLLDPPGFAIPIDTSGIPTVNPAITSFNGGNLFVTYTNKISGTDWQILGKTVSSAGVVGPPVTIFDNGVHNDDSELATLANGNMVVAFDSQDFGTLHDVFVSVRTPAGAAVTGPSPVPISGGVSSDLTVPHVAALADGGFVVSWTEGSTADPGNIRMEVFDGNGVAQSGSILVNTTTAGLQLSQDVAALPDGGFIVGWEDAAAGNDKAQRFDVAGNKVGVEFIFNDHATFDIDAEALADGRSIFTINNFYTVPGNNNVESSIWDSRITDANHVTGANFFGPGGGAADMLIIADHSSNRTAEALQIENGNLQTSQVIAVTGFNVVFDGAGDFNHDGLSDLLAHTDLSTGVRSLFAYQMTPVGVGGTNTVANLG